MNQFVSGMLQLVGIINKNVGKRDFNFCSKKENMKKIVFDMKWLCLHNPRIYNMFYSIRKLNFNFTSTNKNFTRKMNEK